jgi:hypothetical protein
LKKVSIAIAVTVIAVVAVFAAYVLFSQPGTVYDYEKLGSIPLSIEDSESKTAVTCWRTLHSEKYLVKLHISVTGSPTITLEITKPDGSLVYTKTASNSSSPEFDIGSFPEGDYLFTFRASTTFLGVSGVEENAEFLEKFPSADGTTDWLD